MGWETLLAKDLLKWSVIDGGGGGGAQRRQGQLGEI